MPVTRSQTAKRRKVTPDDGRPNFDDLPDLALATVAEFLSKATRPLLAAALTAPSSSWISSKWKKQPSESSTIIMSAKPLTPSDDWWGRRHSLYESFDWSCLDFEDIDKSLARRLTDGDVGGMLVCMDAVHELERLKITNCTNITGRGLEPLRGSLRLNSIDLSLVKHDKSSEPNSQPRLSEYVVIPILYSIINERENSMEHLQLPKKWRAWQSHGLYQFIGKYNEVLHRSEVECSGCEVPCHEGLMSRSGKEFGIQSYTCYKCNEHYCRECKDEYIPYCCSKCEKSCCKDCEDIQQCDKCKKILCYGCSEIDVCDHCQRCTCRDCCYVSCCTCGQHKECEDCAISSAEMSLFMPFFFW